VEVEWDDDEVLSASQQSREKKKSKLLEASSSEEEEEESHPHPSIGKKGNFNFSSNFIQRQDRKKLHLRL
jgi:hypothetical protein